MSLSLDNKHTISNETCIFTTCTYFLLMQVQLVLKEKLIFGSPVLVNVYARPHETKNNQTITVPSLEQGEVKCCNLSKDRLNCWVMSRNIYSSLFLPVCFMNMNTVKECDGKRCGVLERVLCRQMYDNNML